jgi:flagellar biogenesis protein FliO
MLNPDVPFLDPIKASVVTMTVPYLKMRSYSGMMILVGHVAFVISFIWVLMRYFKTVRQPETVQLVAAPQNV